MSNTNQSKEEGSFSGGAEASAANVDESLMPWRVGLFFSSSRPGRKVLMVAVGPEQIGEYSSHKDFIRWVSDDHSPNLADLLAQARDYIPARARPVLLRQVDAALSSQSEAR